MRLYRGKIELDCTLVKTSNPVGQHVLKSRVKCWYNWEDKYIWWKPPRILPFLTALQVTAMAGKGHEQAPVPLYTRQSAVAEEPIFVGTEELSRCPYSTFNTYALWNSFSPLNHSHLAAHRRPSTRLHSQVKLVPAVGHFKPLLPICWGWQGALKHSFSADSPMVITPQTLNPWVHAGSRQWVALAGRRGLRRSLLGLSERNDYHTSVSTCH